MFAGYQCLLDKVGLTFSQLDRVIIAGAFGDFIDLDEAIAIGLLPEIPARSMCLSATGRFWALSSSRFQASFWMTASALQRK